MAGCSMGGFALDNGAAIRVALRPATGVRRPFAGRHSIPMPGTVDLTARETSPRRLSGLRALPVMGITRLRSL